MRIFEVRALSSPLAAGDLSNFVPNFVSFSTSIAELAHGVKSRTQSLNHLACLMRREPKLALRNCTSIG